MNSGDRAPDLGGCRIAVQLIREGRMSPERAITLRNELRRALYVGTALLAIVLVTVWFYVPSSPSISSTIASDFNRWRTHQETASAANAKRIEAAAQAKCADFKVMERQTCHAV